MPLAGLRVGAINQGAIDDLAESETVMEQVGEVADEIVLGGKSRAPVRTGTLRSSIFKQELSDEFRVGWDRQVAVYGPVVEFKYTPHIRPAAEAVKR